MYNFRTDIYNIHSSRMLPLNILGCDIPQARRTLAHNKQRHVGTGEKTTYEVHLIEVEEWEANLPQNISQIQICYFPFVWRQCT